MKILYLVAFILGLICSFGQPPFNYVLPSLCSIALFFFLFEKIKTNKQVFIYSFSFGYGYFIYSQHWMSESVLAYGEKLIWLYPIGIIFIPAFFAFYFVLLGFLVNRYAQHNLIIFAIAWLAVEFLRSYFYIELPWILIGYIWSANDQISQLVSLFGIWGLSFLTIIWASAIYGAFKKDPKYTKFIVLSVISFILCFIYGNYRLKNIPKLVKQDVKVRIVQANIDQNIYSRYQNRYLNLMKHINYSKNSDADHIIWPEGAHEFNVDERLLRTLKNTLPVNSYLIMNGVRREGGRFWNSMFVIDHKGNIFDHYDKIHLVALGEFIPLRTILPFVSKLTGGGGDFSKGNTLKTIKTTPPFMPNICYEAAFAEASDEYFTWILNVTNDGWFGASIGPYQHLAIAKFRSIEFGVPMVRASLTGISAIIDSFGHIVKSIPLLKEGVLDAKLPGYINNSTFYRYWGYYSVILLMLLFVGFNANFRIKRIC